MVEIEFVPNSMQLMFQSRLPPAVNEISDYFDIVFFPRFKTFAIVENKSVVLQ
jgi:hypothetical protein